MSTMKCPNCGCENDDQTVFCSQCGIQLRKSRFAPRQSVQNSGTMSFGWKEIGFILGGTVVCGFLLVLFLFAICQAPTVYVAKLPDFNAATVQVDGYLHKSESCCRAVANAYGAEVIKVKTSDTAGKDQYGRSLSYEQVFYWCPRCS